VLLRRRTPIFLFLDDIIPLTTKAADSRRPLFAYRYFHVATCVLNARPCIENSLPCDFVSTVLLGFHRGKLPHLGVQKSACQLPDEYDIVTTETETQTTAPPSPSSKSALHSSTAAVTHLRHRREEHRETNSPSQVPLVCGGSSGVLWLTAAS